MPHAAQNRATGGVVFLPAFTGAPELNRLYHCDALTLLRALPTHSVDLIATDPPYMNVKAHAWDRQWLARAADNGWPVAVLHRELAAAIGKPVPPRLLLDCEAVVLDCDGGHVTLYIEAAHELAYRQRVTVRVYAAQAEGVGA